MIFRVHAPPPGTPQPDQVRLFVGLDEVGTLALAPPSPEPRYHRTGPTYLRDLGDDAYTAAISSDQPALFQFGRPADDLTLGAVVAVGYDARGDVQPPWSVAAMVAPQLGDGAIYVYDLHLKPAADPSDPTLSANREAPDQLAVWGATQDCVYVKTSADLDGAPLEGFLIGSAADPDCDGLDTGHPLECVAQTHLGDRMVAQAELSCLATSAVATTPQGPIVAACALGGPRCRDGVAPEDLPAAEQCAPSTYCAPSSLCGACSDLGDRWACALDITRSPAVESIARISCEVAATRNDPSAPSELCPSTSEPLALIPSLIPQGYGCQEARVRDRMSDFASALVLESSSSGTDARFDPDVDSACNLTVKVDGSFDALAYRPVVLGLLAIELERNTPHRDLAIPISFRITEGSECPTLGLAVKCTYVAPVMNEETSLAACLNAAPP